MTATQGGVFIMQKYVKWEINYQQEPPPPRGAELVPKFNKWPGSCGKKPSAKSQNSARTGHSRKA